MNLLYAIMLIPANEFLFFMINNLSIDKYKKK